MKILSYSDRFKCLQSVGVELWCRRLGRCYVNVVVDAGVNVGVRGVTGA